MQVAEARAFAALEDGVPAESVNVAVPARCIAADPAQRRGVPCTAAFRDIGTPADYLSTSLELAAIEGDRTASGDRVEIAPVRAHRPHGCVG